jgi:hypothetical protein
MAGSARLVSKNGLFEPFMYTNEHFTKTGSGQTLGKQRTVFPQETTIHCAATSTIPGKAVREEDRRLLISGAFLSSSFYFWKFFALCRCADYRVYDWRLHPQEPSWHNQRREVRAHLRLVPSLILSLSVSPRQISLFKSKHTHASNHLVRNSLRNLGGCDRLFLNSRLIRLMLQVPGEQKRSF